MGAFAGTPYPVALRIDGMEDREELGGPWSSRCSWKREAEGKEAVPIHLFLPDMAGSWHGATGRDPRKGHSQSKLGMSLSLFSSYSCILKSILQMFTELRRNKDTPMGHTGVRPVLRRQHPWLGTAVSHGAGR